jgi:hypothetical protein
VSFGANGVQIRVSRPKKTYIDLRPTRFLPRKMKKTHAEIWLANFCRPIRKRTNRRAIPVFHTHPFRIEKNQRYKRIIVGKILESVLSCSSTPVTASHFHVCLIDYYVNEVLLCRWYNGLMSFKKHIWTFKRGSATAPPYRTGEKKNFSILLSQMKDTMQP